VRRVRSSWGGVSLWPLVEGGGRAPCSRFAGCGGPSSLLVGGGGCGSSSPVAGGGDEPLSLLMGFAAGSSSLSVVGCVRRCRRPSSFSSSSVRHLTRCRCTPASLSLVGFVVPRHLCCPPSSSLCLVPGLCCRRSSKRRTTNSSSFAVRLPRRRCGDVAPGIRVRERKGEKGDELTMDGDDIVRRHRLTTLHRCCRVASSP
jgi:hypothetical protein